ncbi:hypothetical protein BDY17DRAFT_73583 [Neohortaea acidophila]|uniref:F-box domain-containing protein n=1 Tax=Neohortaea acidophila TaxID=245834 RepID=A0A6A6Q1G1_9PEZI|nr:uncharacterized protein BDY17DRAFT_73583 [Neohortaea acidophila]KAF2486240.1 hypothetical protein BDY17DRAFT_73583 [Neohortaea acidophila]
MENSPLDRLPPEVRNLIYNPSPLRLGRRTLILDDDSGEFNLAVPSTCQPPSELPGLPAILGLPATCRFLRLETLQLFFSLNFFVFDTRHFDWRGPEAHKEANDWIPSIESWRDMVVREQFLLMRNVCVDLGYCTTATSNPGFHSNHAFALQKLFGGEQKNVLIRLRTNTGYSVEGFLDVTFLAMDVRRVWRQYVIPELVRIEVESEWRQGAPPTRAEQDEFDSGLEMLFYVAGEMELSSRFCVGDFCCDMGRGGDYINDETPPMSPGFYGSPP